MKRFALTLLFLAACGGGDDDPSPEQSCLDVADAVGDLCVRCTLDTYENCRNTVLQAANGDCSQVKAIRNVDELYGQCLPFTTTVACDVAASEGFELDSSCKGQLLLQ